MISLNEAPVNPVPRYSMCVRICVCLSDLTTLHQVGLIMRLTSPLTPRKWAPGGLQTPLAFGYLIA